MSLRLRLFLGLSCLVAVMVAAQWWWVRELTRDLSDEVDFVAFNVGHSLASMFTHSAPRERTTTFTFAPGEAQATWVGVGDGEAAPPGWIQLDDAEGAVHWIEAEAGDDAPRKVKVAKRFVTGDDGEHEIFLRLETAVAGRASDDSTDHHHEGGEGENVWFGERWFSADKNPPTASFLTVFDTGGDSDLLRIPIPNQGLNEKLESFRRRLMWGSAAILAMGLLLSAVVAHRVSAPLQRLAKAAREVGEGSLGTQVAVSASGEVGQAIHSFNRMSSELEAYDRKTRQLRTREHLGEIGEIARGLAHTLRNPLNALGLSVEELAVRAPGEASGLASSARRQIRRIDQSIRSFLALASQSGGVVTEASPAELVQDVALEALQDSGGKVRLDVDAGAGPTALRAVEPELRAVLQALVVNAVEASPEGGTVSIRVRPAAGSPRVRIEIEDEGPGLPEEVRDRLFTPHLTTKANGSGMGLFLAHRIATNRYAGRLRIEDRGAGGTRAVLEIGPRSQELNHG